MTWHFPAFCIISTILVSCSTLFPKKNDPDAWKKETTESLDAYQKAGGRVTDNQNSNSIVNAGVASRPSSNSLGITPQSDIVYAPEDPNEAFDSTLTSQWAKPTSKTWQTDLQVSAKLARINEKPILIWFTDSSKSPTCAALERELFSQPEFTQWAKDNLILLSIDEFIRYDDENGGMARELTEGNKVKKLRERYSIRGNPTLIVITTNGEVIDKHTGYKKGQSAYIWGKIKHSAKIAQKEYGSWREQMEKRGYRMWTNRSGVKLFAKLQRYTPEKVTFVEPHGARGSTYVRQLSDADQDWLSTQKKKYETSKKL